MDRLIIKRPLITERSMAQTKKGFYTFAVSKDERKESIKKAIEKLFNVNVLSLRTISRPGKVKRSGKTRTLTRSSDWKKVIVKLKKDQKIALFDIGK